MFTPSPRAHSLMTSPLRPASPLQLRAIPADRLLLETDAPDGGLRLGPVCRGAARICTLRAPLARRQGPPRG